jgi:hypothetical protein
MRLSALPILSTFPMACERRSHRRALFANQDPKADVAYEPGASTSASSGVIASSNRSIVSEGRGVGCR